MTFDTVAALSCFGAFAGEAEWRTASCKMSFNSGSSSILWFYTLVVFLTDFGMVGIDQLMSFFHRGGSATNQRS